MRLSCSMIEPGQPWVMIRGRAWGGGSGGGGSGCPGRRWWSGTGQGVQGGLDRAPVVVAGPVAGQGLHGRQPHALESSLTVSGSGQRVAWIRRRNPPSSSSDTTNPNGRMLGSSVAAPGSAGREPAAVVSVICRFLPSLQSTQCSWPAKGRSRRLCSHRPLHSRNGQSLAGWGRRLADEISQPRGCDAQRDEEERQLRERLRVADELDVPLVESASPRRPTTRRWRPLASPPYDVLHRDLREASAARRNTGSQRRPHRPMTGHFGCAVADASTAGANDP
jgi:hypothetical protein